MHPFLASAHLLCAARQLSPEFWQHVVAFGDARVLSPRMTALPAGGFLFCARLYRPSGEVPCISIRGHDDPFSGAVVSLNTGAVALDEFLPLDFWVKGSQEGTFLSLMLNACETLGAEVEASGEPITAAAFQAALQTALQRR